MNERPYPVTRRLLAKPGTRGLGASNNFAKAWSTFAVQIDSKLNRRQGNFISAIGAACRVSVVLMIEHLMNAHYTAAVGDWTTLHDCT